MRSPSSAEGPEAAERRDQPGGRLRPPSGRRSKRGDLLQCALCVFWGDVMFSCSKGFCISYLFNVFLFM